MKLYLKIILLVMFNNILYANTFVQSNLPLSIEERDYLLQKKEIRVYNENEFIPYNYNKNNVAYGFVVDYMNLLAKKLNIKIKYIQGENWKESLSLIKNEEIDVIPNIVKTQDKEDYINFTTPYIRSTKAIFSNNPDIKGISDLKRKTIAIAVQPDIEEYIKENYPTIKIKKYPNILDAVYAVINKEADAIIESYAYVNTIIQKNGLSISFVRLDNEPKLTAEFRIGVRNSQVILRDILEKAKQSVEEAELSKLEQKWFGEKKSDIIIFTKAELEYINNNKTIRVCSSLNLFPYLIFEKDKVSGISLEFLDLITKKTGLNFEIIPSENIEKKFNMIEEGLCDVSSIMIKKPNFHHSIKPTHPIIEDTLVLVTKINEPYVNDFNKLNNKKIAVLKGAKNLIEYVRTQYPNMNIIEIGDNGLKRVEDGEFYGFIGFSYHVSYKIANTYFNELKIMSQIGNKKINQSFGITTREPLLLSIFNKSIDNITPLKKQKIQNGWLSVKVDKNFDYTRFIQFMSIALVIIVILILSYLKQKKLHKKIQELNNSLEEKIKIEIEKNTKQQVILMQQSKLAQMGEMIENIAHQWRQPLAQVNSSVLLVDTALSKDNISNDMVEEKLLEIESLTAYMSKTIDDFKNFFDANKQKNIFSIDDAIGKSYAIVKGHIISNQISIIKDIDEDLDCNSYLDELQQVILTLLNNAIDALIAVKVKKPEIKIEAYLQEKDIIIKIKDNGLGIDTAIIHKIFEPYFTTKHKSQGTGLGLYMAKMIVETALDGTLSVNNNGNGAIFTISIPQ